MAWVAAGLLGLPAWGAAAVGSHSRVIRFEDGTHVRVEAGVLRVPESRTRATGRYVEIPWYRVASTARDPAPPIFILAGGPGASGLDELELPDVRREVAFYRTIADVVLFDQRGAGHSKPVMTCPQTAHYPDDLPLDWARLRQMRQGLLVACRDHWLQRGIQLSAYNTVESAADVDALRSALGYDKVTLVGGSYGSHLALAVMREYPRTVDRAVLYSVEGPDQTWDDPDGVLAALHRYDKALQAQADRLGLHVPEGGWLAALARVERHLAKRPVTVELKNKEDAKRVVVDAALVRRMARHGAGSHDAPYTWANMIAAMDRGDFSLAAHAAIDFRRLRPADPVHYSVDCASGISPDRRRRYEHARATALIGRINRDYATLCPLWPAHDLGTTYRENVVSPIPALLFQGTWDASTPIGNAFEVAAGLQRGQCVTVVGGNHGVLYNLYDHWPPMRALMRAFLSGQDVKAPARVVMQWAKPVSP